MTRRLYSHDVRVHRRLAVVRERRRRGCGCIRGGGRTQAWKWHGEAAGVPAAARRDAAVASPNRVPDAATEEEAEDDLGSIDDPRQVRGRACVERVEAGLDTLLNAR